MATEEEHRSRTRRPSHRRRQGGREPPRRRRGSTLRWLVFALLFFVVVLPCTVAVALFLAVDSGPLVSRTSEITPEHIERARRIAERNDPRKMKPGMLRTLSLSEEDFDLALNYVAAQYAHGSSRVVLLPGQATVSASVELPRVSGYYANVHARLRETAGLPRVDEVRIGSLPVPGWVADLAFERVLQQLNETEDFRAASDSIRTVSFGQQRITVVYAWDETLPERLKAAVLPPEDQERLKAYQARLADLSLQSGGTSPASLTQLLAPLFKLAAERGGDPVAENRTAILALTFYANAKGLSAIVSAARDWPQPLHRTVTLSGREDFPLHFMVSAALAAYAGVPLADAIGLYKEVDDSRGGSGFSFNDIAADRAGTRFGEIATGSAESASKLQRLVGAGVRESDVMPEVADLPEFMPEAEFKQRFGGIGAPTYLRMMENIERRVAALPVNR